jgi:hypothetical protein
MSDTQPTAPATELEEEIRVRVHALAFDNRGLQNEVERLRRAIDRIYWHVPATNGGPLDPCLVGILAEVQRVMTWGLTHD